MKQIEMNKELREIFSQPSFRGRVRFNEPMRLHTSLRIGGPADVFVIPDDISSLRHIIRTAKELKALLIPLGGGSNILVKDKGIHGIVVSLRAFKSLGVEDETTISVDAGLPIQRLIAFSKNKGLTGIEGLVGIPGTVGGAIAGNSGAFGYEIKDVLLDLSLINKRGDIALYDVGDIDLGYRETHLPEGSIIVSAGVRLKKDDPVDVSKRIEGFFAERKKTQPIGERSAGCVFKNPKGEKAGRLIELASCKGMRVGDIEISRVHGNFFINRAKGTAEQFLKLMDMVALRVRRRFGIVLEPEIRIIGC